MTGLLNPFF